MVPDRQAAVFCVTHYYIHEIYALLANGIN